MECIGKSRHGEYNGGSLQLRLSAPSCEKGRGWPIPTPISIFFDIMKPTQLGNGTCYQNGVNVCSTVSSSPSTSVVQPKVCTAETSTEPPGNCTPEEHRDLQNRVENACGAATACKGGDDLFTLNWKIGLQSACIDARRRINDRCFGGGDAGHRLQIEQRKGSIRNCQNFISGFGK